MIPAARRGDAFVCPVHGGGVLENPCCDDVLIEGSAAARVTDQGKCGATGGPNAVVSGNRQVLIGSFPAAGVSHTMAHGGAVSTGAAKVFIGSPRTDANGNEIVVPPQCAYLLGGLDPGSRPADLARHRTPVKKFSKPRSGTFTFPGDSAPTATREYEIEIRGHKVKIIEPVSGAKPGTWLPSAAMIAKGLAALSDEQLAKVNEVIVCPNARPDFPGAVADELNGRVRYFPRSGPHPQFDIDWALTHEGAHALAEDLWSAPGVKDAWLSAMASDARGVTAYGNTDPGEDFAESMVMYALSKGTPCEATARAMFPGRYAQLDKLFPKGFGPKGRRK